MAVSLACVGCGRLPSDMDDEREKHPVCHTCVKRKLPTTYWCCVGCPGNPGAMQLHMAYHKEVKRHRKETEDGVLQQQNREAAEKGARYAAQTGDKYLELLADGALYLSKEDTRRAARTYREAIALRPVMPNAYHGLGAALASSGHDVEAAQRYLEARERYPVGAECWAVVTAVAFDLLKLDVCAEVAKPEWWNDEGLKALSARVVRTAPDDGTANQMRAFVLCGNCVGWEAGPRSAAELREAATHYDRAAALNPAPAAEAYFAGKADCCRRTANAMYRL